MREGEGEGEWLHGTNNQWGVAAVSVVNSFSRFLNACLPWTLNPELVVFLVNTFNSVVDSNYFVNGEVSFKIICYIFLLHICGTKKSSLSELLRQK